MGEVSFAHSRRDHSLEYQKMTRKSIGIFVVALGGLILFLIPIPASAQSCALCYTQAASSGARMIQALKSGILILIAPPTVMSVGVIFVCYRKRNQTMKDAGESELEWTKRDR
jgi:hypothetical protein